MFLANSLKDKLKRNFLESDPDSLGKAPFPYSPPPHDPRILLSFKGSAQGLPASPSEEFSTQKLQALNKQEWQDTFTLNRLRSQWETRVDLNFENKHKKFPNEMILPEVKENKRYIKNLTDPDILDLKQKRWNLSSDKTDKSIRPELKKTLFEVSHGLKNFTIVPLKEKVVEEGCDSRNIRVIDGLHWDISTRMEDDDKKQEEYINKTLATENSLKYWKDNEMNRKNENAFPISEDRKKLEIIRYFKKYRNPYQKSLDYLKTMEKVKSDTAITKTEVEESVKYRNPGALKYPEKINALVFKEMYNTYKYKYNELIGKLDKEEIKKRQKEENKFRWNDKDLITKMQSVNSLKDVSWFKPEFAKKKIGRSYEKFRKELLKPLVIKGNDIHNEQEKIHEILEDQYKKQQKRELLLKQKFSSKKSTNKIESSKYPINKEKYETLKTIQNENEDIKKSGNEINILENKLKDDHFVDAYKKVTEDEIERKNKLYNKYKGNVDVIYSHPGTFRTFEMIEKETKRNSPDSPEYVVKNKVNVKLWSCCMNTDEHSKGCHKEVVKKFRWLYDE